MKLPTVRQRAEGDYYNFTVFPSEKCVFQRRKCVLTSFFPLEKGDFPSESAGFSSKELVAREFVERFDFGDLVARASLVPFVRARHDGGGLFDGVGSGMASGAGAGAADQRVAELHGHFVFRRIEDFGADHFAI